MKEEPSQSFWQFLAMQKKIYASYEFRPKTTLFNTIIITQYTTHKIFAKITFSWETHLDQLGLLDGLDGFPSVRKRP